MASAKGMVAVFIAVAIAAILLGPTIAAVQDNTGTQTINESVTADHGNWTELEGYQVVENSETIEATDGTAYSSGTDYEMAYENGSIKALSSGTITDGETLNATYDYKATDGMTTTIIGYGPLFLGLLLLVTLASKVQESL